MQIYLAECQVVEADATVIRFHIGGGVTLSIPTTHFPNHQVKVGAIIPLFTEIPHADLYPVKQ